MKKVLFVVISLLLFGALGCSNYVTVTHPPKVDLKSIGTIGVVKLEVEGAQVVSAEEVTHRFLATIQSAQPGVRLLELGTEKDVLKAVGHGTLDLKAIKAIGREYGVDAVLTGDMSVSEVRPNFSVNQALTSMSAQAAVNGALRGKLREAKSGATIWTNGAHGKWNVAGVSLAANGMPKVYGLEGPDQKYEKMLTDLVKLATNDFRPTYERRKVKD